MVKYQCVERALNYAIYEAYLNGVSTRKMGKLFETMGINNLDKSTVSRLIQPIVTEIDNWRNRQLNEE